LNYLDKDQMLSIFIQEGFDILDELSNALLELEKDRENTDIIKEIFRHAHTLKGSSASLHSAFQDDTSDIRIAYTGKMAEVTHEFENLMSEARDNGMKLTEEHIDLLFETEQLLETLMHAIDYGEEKEIDISLIHAKLKDAPTPKEETAVSLIQEETDEYGVTFQLLTDLDPDFMYASLFFIYREIEDKYDNPTFSPSISDLEKSVKFENVFVTVYTTENTDIIINYLESIQFITNVALVKDTRNMTNESVPPVPVQEVEKIEQEPLPTISSDVSSPPVAPPTPKPKEETSSVPASSERTSAKKSSQNNSIRVLVDRVDEVLKHASSLVLLRNRLLNHAKKIEDKTLHDIIDEISQTINSQQDAVMDIRMTPLDQLFGRFPKDVRNIAKDFNKKVKFECIGGETEIDKSLLDELGKPLVHLIKNSVFHGIESAEERLAAGKPSEGLLRLSAKHDHGNVVLTIEDDGKGIDVDAVRKKAIERGLLTPEKAANSAHEEIINLIFHPGLSTAKEVNGVAGRGVGMDAVQAVVDKMKGHIEVESEKGKGTKTIIKLPLSLAIIRSLLTKINGEYFSIPIAQDMEAVEILAKDIKYVANKEVYFLRDNEIPIIRLNEFFNIPSQHSNAEKINVVVLTVGNKTVGLTVDEALDLEDIVVKNIGEYLGNIRGISGSNINGDGAISLIIDVNSIINPPKSKKHSH